MENSMTLGEVQKYVAQKYDIKRSRQSIYNWAKIGIKLGGQFYVLQTETNVAGDIRTNAEWVDNFVNMLAQRGYK